MPVSGGVLDQPAGLLRKMRSVKNVYLSHKKYQDEGKEAGAMASWKKENETAWNIVREVNELRAKYG